MTLRARSRRCQLFEKIASNTWQQMIRYHRHGIHLAEIGKTNEIIVEIMDSQLKGRNIDVWAANGVQEHLFGSDLDVFVEARKGIFVWWALQAKVLSVDGYYHGLAKRSDMGYQWDKLNNLYHLTGCLPRYLLYNGVEDFELQGVDACSRPFGPDQYGCSLVEIHDMERIALSGAPTFRDFHPKFARPWRTIVCCPISTKMRHVGYYSLVQVQAAMGHYPTKAALEYHFDWQNAFEYEARGEPDAILVRSAEAKWEPAFRMMVRNAVSLE